MITLEMSSDIRFAVSTAQNNISAKTLSATACKLDLEAPSSP